MSDQATFHDELRATLDGGDEQALVAVMKDARPADIAESFEVLSDEERSRVFFALSSHIAAEVVVTVDEAVRGEVVEDLDTESLSEIVAELAPDDAADVLSELDREEIGQILEHIKPEQSNRIEELLEYEEDTAGGIMTPDVVAVPASKTVGDAVEYVREASQEEELHEIYIVDDERKLIGTVPLRRLVTSSSSRKLEAICDSDPVTVRVTDDQETVVQIIRKYDVLSAAVVDANGVLLGRITNDDLLDVAEEEAAEDLYRMAGTDAAEFETSSVLHAAWVRLKWLLPCMLGTLGTAGVLLVSRQQFDPLLFAALVSFVPMIGAMGGNAGIQISTVIVRGFAAGDLAATQVLRTLNREGRIAVAMAPVCGVTAWALATFGLAALQTFGLEVSAADHTPRIALAIGIAMTSAILLAAMLGIFLPFAFRRLGIDPAIASGPLVTTTNDVVSVTIYMVLAIVII